MADWRFSVPRSTPFGETDGKGRRGLRGTDSGVVQTMSIAAVDKVL